MEILQVIPAGAFVQIDSAAGVIRRGSGRQCWQIAQVERGKAGRRIPAEHFPSAFILYQLFRRKHFCSAGQSWYSVGV